MSENTQKKRGRPPKKKVDTNNSSVSLSPSQFDKFLKDYRKERSFGLSSSDMSRKRYDWASTSLDIGSHDIRIIVNRALRAYRDNTYIQSAIRVLKTNIFADLGIRPKSSILLSSGEPNKILNDQLNKLWDRFNDFAFRNFTFLEIENSIFTSVVLTGNVFIVKQKPLKNSPFSFSLKVLDTSHLDFSKDTLSSKKKDGSYIKHGIHYDSDDEPIFYHFKGNNRVPASQVIHAFMPDTADSLNSNFGMPLVTACLPQLYDLQMLMENSILASKVNSCFIMWLKSGQEFAQSQVDAMQIWESEDKPELFEGSSKIEKEVRPLLEMIISSVASSLGLSYSSLLKELGGESYSGGRLRSLSEHLTFTNYSKWFTKAIIKPVWEWFVNDCVVSGKIDLSVSDYVSDQWKYNEMFAINPPFVLIDESKQAQTDVLKLQNNMMSLKEYWSSKGRSLESVIEELKAEKEMLKKAGLLEDNG